ncbi:hypothetical protein HFO99_24425 [Rhizobium leguminosarum]|uniref:hypothetical protein n=1 Tax=Rhizobium leguminosarum TaxID=384 RepID=UPI001C94FCB2|nr:hypothetical protein [Rhizobium leguminosarum]MBY5337020.1 hypothetical protein [Rhizobium leguminosarum]
MRDRRDHLIVACQSGDAASADFLQAAQYAKGLLGNKVLVAKVPPPEREVALSLEILSPIDLSTRSLRRTFALALDRQYLSATTQIGDESFGFLDGVVSRIAAENELSSYYGLKVIIFVANQPEEICIQIYQHFADWCHRIGNDLGRQISFDMACSQEDLRHVLGNEHRRMVHGDIKAQWAFVRALL